MAKIYNSDLTKGLAKNAGIQQSVDKVPNELAEKIVPVMETNPQLLRNTNFIKSSEMFNSTGTTIYTTPTDRDFYITGATMSFIKDAGNLSTKTYLSCLTAEQNTRQNIFTLNQLSGTAQSGNASISFRYPIKVQRGSSINLNSTDATANIRYSADLYGYHDDVANS